MEIIPPDFLIIPYILIIDPEINPIDEKLYGVIYWFSKLKNESCTAGNDTLAKLVKTTTATIANSLSALEKREYIKRIFFDKAKRHRKEIIPLVVFAKIKLVDTPTDERGFNPQVKEINPQVKDLSPTDEQNNNNKKEKQIIKGTAEQAPQNEINFLLGLFKGINPSYERLFGNTTQRKAMQRLLTQHGVNNIVQLLGVVPKTNQMQYAPTITTPAQLEDKFASLAVFITKEKLKVENNNRITKI